MRDNESSYQAARQYQAEHSGVSYTRAKRVTAAPMVTRIVFSPAALRASSGRLMSLASQLRSDPGSRDSVVTDVVALLRELAGDQVSRTEVALAAAADAFEVRLEVTAEPIEKLAQQLNALADDVSAAVAQCVSGLNEGQAKLDRLVEVLDRCDPDGRLSSGLTS